MKPPRILIAGGTGFVGQVLQRHALERGWTVRLLVRHATDTGITAGVECHIWDSAQGKLEADAIQEVDYMVNLAGSTIFQPWTKKNKAQIRNSRLNATTLLFNVLKTNPHAVKAYVGASAVGIYANEPDYTHTESFNKPNPFFLGHIVHQWEQAHKRMEQLDIATTILRFGLVLGPQAGFVEKQIGMARKLGWPYFGNGEQWQSWIHVEDLAALICWTLENNFTGIANAVTEQPIQQKALMHRFAESFPLKKRVLGIPAWLLRLGLGERADLLLDSNKVLSDRLPTTTFKWQFPDITSASLHLAEHFDR